MKFGCEASARDVNVMRVLEETGDTFGVAADLLGSGMGVTAE
jgi:hypothetical protein